jgi:hypothetical protein
MPVTDRSLITMRLKDRFNDDPVLLINLGAFPRDDTLVFEKHSAQLLSAYLLIIHKVI